MIPQWKDYPASAIIQHIQEAELKLTDGSTLHLTNYMDTKEQTATLSMLLNGVNYAKRFRRVLPNDTSIENAVAWCFQELTTHLSCLENLLRDTAAGMQKYFIPENTDS